MAGGDAPGAAEIEAAAERADRNVTPWINCSEERREDARALLHLHATIAALTARAEAAEAEAQRLFRVNCETNNHFAAQVAKLEAGIWQIVEWTNGMVTDAVAVKNVHRIACELDPATASKPETKP